MLRLAWFFLLLLHFGIAQRRRYGFEARIVGGMATSIALQPYLVNLRQDELFICGGSLVTPMCVLTAAHCVYGATPQGFSVHAGASKLSETAPVQRDVTEFFVSPDFTMSNLDMDAAILRLSQPVQPTKGGVSTIELCNSVPADDSYVKISGWGITREDSREPADQLRTANVRVLSQRKCQRAYLFKATLTSSMYCASVPGMKDSCSGDSGGPVVQNGKLCGIVSWGFGCARAAYPGVYTNVASSRVRKFIRQTLTAHCYGG